MYGLTMKVRYFWIWQWNIKLLKCKKKPSDASQLQRSGRIDVIFIQTHVKSSARKVKTSTVWIMSAIYLLLLLEDIKLLKQMSHTKKWPQTKGTSQLFSENLHLGSSFSKSSHFSDLNCIENTWFKKTTTHDRVNKAWIWWVSYSGIKLVHKLNWKTSSKHGGWTVITICGLQKHGAQDGDNCNHLWCWCVWQWTFSPAFTVSLTSCCCCCCHHVLTANSHANDVICCWS